MTSTYFDEDALKILGHGHAAQFHAKVPNFEPRALGFDLDVLFNLVDVAQLHHQQIKQPVGYQRYCLVVRLQGRKY